MLLVGVPLKQCRWWPQLFCDLKYLGRLLSSWGFISTPDKVRLSHLCLIVQHLCIWDLESSFEMLPQSRIKIPVFWARNDQHVCLSTSSFATPLFIYNRFLLTIIHSFILQNLYSSWICRCIDWLVSESKLQPWNVRCA